MPSARQLDASTAAVAASGSAVPRSAATETPSPASPSQAHPNLHPVFAVLETDDAYFWLGPRGSFTLADVVQLKEGGIGRSVARKLFVVYQLLQGLTHLHAHGIVHGRYGAGSAWLTRHGRPTSTARAVWLRRVPVAARIVCTPGSLGMEHVLVDDVLWARLTGWTLTNGPEATGAGSTTAGTRIRLRTAHAHTDNAP